MEREELVLLIAECLIEPAYPEDALKQAENIVMRIERREKIKKSDAAIEKLNQAREITKTLPDYFFDEEEADIEDLPRVKPINGLNED